MNSAEQFTSLSRLIRNSAPSNCLGPGATAARIHETELALHVRLPASYKWFFAEFGWAAWPDYIAGITNVPTGIENVVALTRMERTDVEPEMPFHLIPFSPDGWGNHYCLDTSKFEGDECPVVFWNHELTEEQVPTLVFGSFFEWLKSTSEECLEYENAATET